MPELHERLLQASVADLLEGYAQGTFTPEAVVAAYLQRIAQHDGRFAAYVCVDGERARQAAQLAGERWRAGQAGALEGVPIAVKDLMDVAGLPTLAGSRTRASTPAADTATVVRRLTDAGAIVLGKTHTEEFAFGSWGVNESLGTPLNPWSREQPLVPGGSSSGSAVAVAAGLAPWAIGTDTGGSVRGPAGWQGLVGYKPTPGRISAHGVVPLSPSLDTVGVLCRCVRDAVRFAHTVQGEDEHDPDTWGVATGALDAGLEAGVQGLRIAVLGAADRAGVDPQVLLAYDAVVVQLQAQGAQTQVLNLPFTLASLADASVSPTMAVEAYAQHGALADDPASALSAPVRARLLAGRMQAGEFMQRQWRHRRMLQTIVRAMTGCDALLVPTMPFPAIPVAEVNQQRAATLLTRFVNQLGWPGVAVPSGLSVDGRPLSVQCIARAHDDALALRVARAVEQLTPPLGLPWQCRTPS